MRTFDEIVQLTLDMQAAQSPLIRRMQDVLTRYEGDYVLPMPETADERPMPPLTPQLIGEAVDQMAMRAASVRPMVTCPAVDPYKDTGVRSRQYAQIRRRILAATYDASKWKLGRRRYMRQLAAYHTASVVVVPNFELQMPVIEVRDPLATFVEPMAYEQLRVPNYAAFITRYSGDWLRRRFPEVQAERGGPITSLAGEELWDVVEWYDTECCVWGLLGPQHPAGRHINERSATRYMQLSPQYTNKARVVPVIAPHMVSLGKIASRLASMIGNVDLQAKLTALDILAQEKAIFPDTYLVGRQGGMPMIVGGAWEDGRTGNVNLLQDVEMIGQLRNTPDLRTTQTIDRLERNFRTSVGLVPQMGGETYGALRTGRGIDALMGVAVDQRVQELHEIDETYMPHLNEAIFETYRGYWGSKKYARFSGWAGDTGEVEFTPNVHIETVQNTVAYPIAGADVIQLTQIFGSLYGAGAISRRSFRQGHPWINDAEQEAAWVEEEQIEEALKRGILQKLETGAFPLEVAVRIRDELANGKDIFAAVAAADRAIREMQATPAPPAPEGMVAAPEQMPGMAAPSPEQMVMQPPPAGEPPARVQVPGDVSAMRQLMETMRA